MGTNTIACISHPFDSSSDVDIGELLDRCCPSVHAIVEYWAKPEYSRGPTSWGRGATFSTLSDLPLSSGNHLILGPGRLTITFGASAARILCCRWREFLTIPPLRKVYRDAVTEIARTLHSPHVVWVSDDADEVTDTILLKGKSLDSVISLLRREWGEPLRATTAELIRENKVRPPDLWLLDEASSVI